MRVVIDIGDETFPSRYPEYHRTRVARYLRNVAAAIERGCDESGLVPLTSDGPLEGPHVAGWAVESAPWRQLEVAE